MLYSQNVKRPYGRLCVRKFKLAITQTKVNLRLTSLYLLERHNLLRFRHECKKVQRVIL